MANGEAERTAHGWSRRIGRNVGGGANEGKGQCQERLKRYVQAGERRP